MPSRPAIYVPKLDGGAFQEALRRDRSQAKLMLHHEARSMELFFRRVLAAEGFGWFFSWAKGRRRGRLYAQAEAAVLAEAGDLGPFSLGNMLIFGYIHVRDLEQEQADRVARREAAEAVRNVPPPETLYRNTHTNQIRNAEQKNMDILFGRAHLTDFERSGQT